MFLDTLELRLENKNGSLGKTVLKRKRKKSVAFKDKQVILVDFWDNVFLTVFSKFSFSTINSRMSRNICELRYKLHNGQNLLPWSPNFKHFQYDFSKKMFAFQIGLLKKYSINPSLKNALLLYVFESLR